MTQELLALVTGLAHYLKILIRIALTGALKLERDYGTREAMSSFLDKLHLLAVQGANPAARRMIKGHNGEVIQPDPNRGNYGTQCVTYGFRSLAPENAGDSPFSLVVGGTGNASGPNKVANSPPSDLCVKCNQTVEEDCVRLGTYQRWHSNCVQCAQCGKVAAVPLPKELQASNAAGSKSGDERDGSNSQPQSSSSKPSSQRRPPANVRLFVYDSTSMKETASFGEVPTVILCTEHAHSGCKSGFQAVQRLEQYAFLLNVALRRLYLLLKKQGVVPISPVSTGFEQQQLQQQHGVTEQNRDPYKSLYLDRKLSATTRLPKRSTIIESPTEKMPTSAESHQKYYESYTNMGPSTTPQPTTPYRATQPSQQQAAQVQYQQGQPGPPRSGPSKPAEAVPTSPDQPARLAYDIMPGSPSPVSAGEYSPLDQYQSHSSQSSSYQSQQPSQSQHSQYPQSQQTQYQQSQQYSQSQQYPQTQQSQYPSPSHSQYPHSNHQRGVKSLDDGITLADIPQLMEEAQAREQHRSLPRESSAPYIAELQPLELALIKHFALLHLTRSPLKDTFDLDEILEMIEMKKSGFWNKLFKGDKKNVKKKGTFAVPLELLVEREGADSMLGATRVTMRVPSFIDDVISAMRTMGKLLSSFYGQYRIDLGNDTDLSIEGIFRKNGNIRRLKDLTEALDRDPASVDLTQDNPVQLAALMKKFLRELPEPLMTFKLHRLFVASQCT